MRTFAVPLATLVFSGLLVACGPSGGGDDDDDSGDGGPSGAVLEVSPGTSQVTVVDGVAATQGFTATVRYEDGSTEEVTGQTSFQIDDPRLGSFAGATFTAQGLAGGLGSVRASYQGLFGDASIEVFVEQTRVVDPAPADAADLFDAASDAPGLAPAIVYPDDGVMVPPNLGDFEIHWRDTAGADLFEVSLASQYVTLRVFMNGPPMGGAWTAFTPDEWSIAGDSNRGEEITLTVRGMMSASPQTAGTSPAVTALLTDEDVEGGIYYWAAASQSGPAGIYRHDMSRPGESAEIYYTTAESPGGRCVACHVLSRDGERMAITYDGGNGAASILEVGTRTEMLATDGTFAWNFATFEPDRSRILTVHRGVMSLRDPNTGGVLGTVTTPSGWGSHPDFKPSGDAIVYTDVASPSNDWTFTGGSIVTQPFDPVAGTFGAPQTLVPNAGPNNYYPSWSPDGEWILFNRSTEDAYDDGSAEIYVVKADGTIGPIKLDLPNVGAGLTNSWARWAPFEQTLGEGEDAETFYWFTFSSRREFGVRMVSPEARPQIWMAPFFPARAAVAQPPSAPAFRLPFQDLDGNNHIAQWTEQVVPIE